VGFLTFRSKAFRDLLAVLLIVTVITALLGLIHGISILQYVINGLIVGSIYVLGATGLTLIFGIRKFSNFAHGDMMTYGAYMAYLANVLWFLDIIWGFVFAILMTAVLGILMELLVFRKLAGRGPVSALVASIGIMIFLQNFLNGTFGTSINQYNIRLTSNIVLWTENGISVVSIPPLRGITVLVVSAVIILLLHVLLSRTTMGKAMRATADNPDLARASGIRVRGVILWTWALTGAMAGVAGVLLGIFIDVRPGLGFNVLLFIFAAVIVGGIGSPYGAMLGGLVVGIAQELSAAFLVWLGRDEAAQGIVDAFRSPAAIAVAVALLAVLLAHLSYRVHVPPREWVRPVLLAGLILFVPIGLAFLAPPQVGGLEQPVAYRPIAAFGIMILVLLLRPAGLAAGKTSGPRVGRGFSLIGRSRAGDRASR